MSQYPESLQLAPIRQAQGGLRLPGSKSVSIRTLLLAALSAGETRLHGLLDSDDTRVMTGALSACGVSVTWEDVQPGADTRTATVFGTGAFSGSPAETAIFLGNSGLSARTLLPVLAFTGGHYRLSGVARMHERPIGDLVDALRPLGANIEYLANPGYPPLRVLPAYPRLAGAVRVRGNASSQFLTGILQAAPLLAAQAELVIEVEGELISKPYIALTLAMMERFGVNVVQSDWQRFAVPAGARFRSPGALQVEGDASSASYFLALGAIAGGPVRVYGMDRKTLQGDVRFADAVAAMGADITYGEGWTEVVSPGVDLANPSGFRLKAIDADFNHIPDAAMTIAVLALFADGPSTLRNIGSWRVKETDRIAAMAAELAKLGAVVESGPDWLRVFPPSATEPLRSAAIDTYDDHRIAMCFSLVACAGIAVTINDPGCVAKTFPDYFERLGELVA